MSCVWHSWNGTVYGMTEGGRQERSLTGQRPWDQEVWWLLARNCEITEDNGDKREKAGGGETVGITQGQSRNTDTEKMVGKRLALLFESWKEKSVLEKHSNVEAYITICKIDSQREFAVWLRKLEQGLCINLEGWDGEGDGREIQKERGIYIYLWLIHVEVWQKTTKFCKAIILQ